jgi:hypothetical protein
LKFALAHDEDQSMKRSRFSEEQIIGILKERGRRFGRRSVPQARRQRRQHLQMESEVRRDGGLGGQAAWAGFAGFPLFPAKHWRRVWVSACAIGGLRYAERFRAEQIDVLRFAMILAVTLSAISVSITTHAQPSDEDIARAKEKLKSALEDQVGLRAKSAMDNDLSAADYNRFRELDIRIRPIADDLAAVMMRPPMPGGDTLQT